MVLGSNPGRGRDFPYPSKPALGPTQPPIQCVDCVWNVMAQAQKPDFVFRWNGRFHLNWQGRQFSRLLAAELCASAVVMLDTPRSEVVWEYWLPTPFARFTFTSSPVRHRVPSGFKRTLPGLSRGWSRRGVALTTSPHLEPSLKKEYSYTCTPPLGLCDLL
jgi:hypothetical protein